jgi:hypothetical protein
MARMRIKYELNPGGVGVRLDKLAKISEEFEKFLRSLAQDCGVSVNIGDWLAKDFYNGSFGSTVEYVKNVEVAAAVEFNDGIRFFSQFKNGSLPSNYSPATIKQFIEIGTAIDADEKIKVGVFQDVDADDGEPIWEQITKLVTTKVEAVFHDKYRYEGALQGKLGTWYKDSDYFYLRDLASGSLIKCFYPIDMYEIIYGLFGDKDAVVNVSGRIVANRNTGQIEEMRVTWAKSYAPLSKHEYDKLFGIAPDLTGDLTTDEYINRIRDGEA